VVLRSNRYEFPSFSPPKATTMTFLLKIPGKASPTIRAK
jgi:hypothetical protein